METTCDGLLDKRVTIEQPKDGYRVAVDTVLLAASVPARAGETALDLGCGAGGAMLCLAARLPGVFLTGVEIQKELADLCAANIARNKFAGLNVLRADAALLPGDLAGTFDHVLMNPPYHDEARHDVSADARKRMANTEREGDLARWVTGAAKALKPSGTLTLVHRADRQAEIEALLAPEFGAVEILPILPKPGIPPKRVIVRGKKGGTGAARLCRHLVLHQADGRYTGQAEAILRHAKALEFRHEAVT